RPTWQMESDLPVEANRGRTDPTAMKSSQQRNSTLHVRVNATASLMRTSSADAIAGRDGLSRARTIVTFQSSEQRKFYLKRTGTARARTPADAQTANTAKPTRRTGSIARAVRES